MGAFECPRLSATEQSPPEVSHLPCLLKTKNKNKSKARKQKKPGEGMTVVSIPDQRGNIPHLGVQKPKF